MVTPNLIYVVYNLFILYHKRKRGQALFTLSINIFYSVFDAALNASAIALVNDASSGVAVLFTAASASFSSASSLARTDKEIARVLRSILTIFASTSSPTFNA